MLIPAWKQLLAARGGVINARPLHQPSNPFITNVASPTTLAHNSTDHAQVTAVAFSADGKFLAGSSIMGLDLWDVATWKAVHGPPPLKPAHGDPG